MLNHKWLFPLLLHHWGIYLIEKIKIQELLSCCPLWGGRIFLDTMTLEKSRKNLVAKGKLAVWLAFEERNFVWNRIAKGKFTVWLAIEERVCSMELHLLTRVASKNFKQLTNLFELFFARVYREIPVIFWIQCLTVKHFIPVFVDCF